MAGAAVPVDRARPPILMIHGACSGPAHMAPWADYFRAAGYEVTVPALPGHDPDDPRALDSLTIPDFVAHLGQVHKALTQGSAEPARWPIIIGYSMGGMLAQLVAAGRRSAAVVLVASATAGRLLPPRWRLAAHVPVLGPSIIMGRSFLPSRETFQSLVVHDLGRDEQESLLGGFGHESGKAFRAVVLGAMPRPPRDLGCPVLCLAAGDDRIVAASAARQVADYYRAFLHIFPRRSHWLVAASGVDEVAAPVLAWLEQLAVADRWGRPSFESAADL